MFYMFLNFCWTNLLKINIENYDIILRDLHHRIMQTKKKQESKTGSVQIWQRKNALTEMTSLNIPSALRRDCPPANCTQRSCPTTAPTVTRERHSIEAYLKPPGDYHRAILYLEWFEGDFQSGLRFEGKSDWRQFFSSRWGGWGGGGIAFIGIRQRTSR